jgi:PIN domain nuclease of toxin-antitoxin system
LLWWIAGDTALSSTAHSAIADERNAVFNSAASAWEIATKFRIGKLPGVAAIAADLAALLDSQGFVPLPISFVHGQLAGALPGPLRDPFDRMLIAQAIHEDMVLVSNEVGFGAYGVRRLW